MADKQAKAQFKRRSTANNVEIIVPVPEDADTPRFRTTIGSVYYVPEKSAIVWKIKQFGGGKEFLMRAELGLPSVKGSISPQDQQLTYSRFGPAKETSRVEI